LVNPCSHGDDYGWLGSSMFPYIDWLLTTPS
jgi:hypothetical protein